MIGIMAAYSNSFGIDIEILLSETSLLDKDSAILLVKQWLQNHPTSHNGVYTQFDDKLSGAISKISVYNNSANTEGDDAPEIHFHPYLFNSFAPEIDQTDDDQNVSLSTQWVLPTKCFDGLWESLYYESQVKNHLLNYMSTALKFSEKCVDPNIVSWNRIVLLHGPPGTGKTSLCKALSQKISIRFSSKYTYGHLIEVNTHSLFSKWFSESGKLVTKMFHSIRSLVEDPNVLVIVLLDEVETLACSRSTALNGNEPSDALRVVNALLTHLDMIKRYPNVLILTTSNITDAIDVALIDRADIKQYIGLPSVEAIYEIYCSCIKELQTTRIICTENFFIPLRELNSGTATGGDMKGSMQNQVWSEKLKSISELSVGLSGRSLRKMPFMACSLFVKSSVITLDDFLEALSNAVKKNWEDVKHLKVHV